MSFDLSLDICARSRHSSFPKHTDTSFIFFFYTQPLKVQRESQECGHGGHVMILNPWLPRKKKRKKNTSCYWWQSNCWFACKSFMNEQLSPITPS